MRIRATGVLAAVFIYGANSVPARADMPESQGYGVGDATSCGEWVDERTSKNWRVALVKQNLNMQWLLGWLSAAGAYNTRGPLRHTEWDAVTAWLDKYCHEHPRDKIKDAAASLVDELSKPK